MNRGYYFDERPLKNKSGGNNDVEVFEPEDDLLDCWERHHGGLHFLASLCALSAARHSSSPQTGFVAAGNMGVPPRMPAKPAICGRFTSRAE